MILTLRAGAGVLCIIHPLMISYLSVKFDIVSFGNVLSNCRDVIRLLSSDYDLDLESRNINIECD